MEDLGEDKWMRIKKGQGALRYMMMRQADTEESLSIDAACRPESRKDSEKPKKHKYRKGREKPEIPSAR